MSGANLPPSSEAPAISELIQALAYLAVYRTIDKSRPHWIRRELLLDHMRLQLLNDVAMARLRSRDAAGYTAAPSDVERQLKAMLKLDDAGLSKAIEDCDTRTYAAIEAAEDAIWHTPEAVHMTAAPAPRRVIGIALANEQAQDAKRGRKEKTYQLELARTCCEVWGEHKPAGARGRPAFIRTVFEAAGMPLSDKRLEALAARIAPPTQKRERIK